MRKPRDPTSSLSRRGRRLRGPPGSQARHRGSDPTPHRHGVQIDAQLVRMIEIVRPDRMRVEVDAAQVDDPGKGGVVVHDDLVGCPPRRETEFDGVDPRWPGLRRALLKEELALDPVDEPLQRHRPTRHAGQRTVGDGDVAANQIGLGVTGVREQHLLRLVTVTSWPANSSTSVVRAATAGPYGRPRPRQAGGLKNSSRSV